MCGDMFKKLSGLNEHNCYRHRNSKYLRKIHNKLVRSINGNIKNVIKITAWNKGGLDLNMKRNQIKEIIEDKKSDIVIVNELNLDYNSDPNIANIKDFPFQVDKLYKKMALVALGCGCLIILYMIE